MTKENTPFPVRLKAWRKRLSIGQEKAAAALGIGRSYYNRLESGKKPPGRFLLEKFEVLEREPVTSGHTAPPKRTEESAPHYRFIQKVIDIQKDGTDEQRELLEAFVDSIYQRLDLPAHQPVKDGKSG